MSSSQFGMLYIVGTPIGNLEDISIRALKALRQADRIACEDTRHTLKLLNHFHIRKPLFSYREHNEKTAANYIAESVERGEHICLVSDAGMPLISDPGSVVLSIFIDRNLPYTVLPGPNAGLTGLIASGLSTKYFCFFGFLPVKGKARQVLLTKIADFSETIILYEAPHRLIQTLEDLKINCPGRKIALCRELTKKYEEILRFDLDHLDPDSITPRGEYVIVIDAKELEDPDYDIEQLLMECLKKGMSKKDAVKEVCRVYDLPKNDVYKISLLL